MSGSLYSITIMCSAGLVLVAALHDAAVRTIPDWIPVSLALAGLGLRLWDGNAIAGLVIAVLLLVFFGILWLCGFIGGGDMKLIPAVALVLPPSGVPAFILCVALAGGPLALTYLALSFVVPRPGPGPRRGLAARILKAEAWRMHRRGPLPYALAIGAGALPVFINMFSR